MGNEKLERVKTLTAVLTNATQLAVGGRGSRFCFHHQKWRGSFLLNTIDPECPLRIIRGYF